MNDKRKKNNYLVYVISVTIIVLITAMAGFFPKAFGTYAQHIYNFISCLLYTSDAADDSTEV